MIKMVNFMLHILYHTQKMCMYVISVKKRPKVSKLKNKYVYTTICNMMFNSIT